LSPEISSSVLKTFPLVLLSFLCGGKLPALSHGGESGSGGYEERGSPERRQRVGWYDNKHGAAVLFAEEV